MVGLLQAFWAAFDPGASPNRRGMRLLRAHLTPAHANSSRGAASLKSWVAKPAAGTGCTAPTLSMSKN
jgi:hypothetical protein